MTGTAMTTALLLSLVTPLFMAALVLVRDYQSVLIRLLPLAALPGLMVAFSLPLEQQVIIPWLLMGSRLILDDTARLFLLLTTMVWAAAALYASAYASQIQYRTRFYVSFLLAMAGNIGVTLAGDAASFYTFFALMSFAAYGMIVADDTPATARAGRIYVSFVIVGEVMLFSGLVMGSQASATLNLLDTWSIGTNNLAATLIIFGFGIKAGALPFHFILPIVYRAAAPPAAVALAGAMLNAGFLGWLRFLPLGQEALPVWGPALMALGLGAAFYGVAMGLTQSNAKALLGYSSVSQIGLMTCGVGLALYAPMHWEALSVVLMGYAIHHALAKGALFYAVTLPAARARWALLWQRIALILPALAISGAPFTSGVIAKDTLKAALSAAPLPWSQWFTILLPLSAIATAVLMLRLLILAWPRQQAAQHGVLAVSTGQLFLIGAMALLTARWALQESTLQLWSIFSIVNATWPLLVAGAIVALAVFVLQPRWRINRWQLPPGDVWLWLERGWSWLPRLSKPPSFLGLYRTLHTCWLGAAAYELRLERIEDWLRKPLVAGLAAVLIFFALLLAMV